MHNGPFTLRDLFRGVYQTHSAKVAVVFAGQSQSYQQIHHQANQVAHAMLSVGIHIGSRVALLLSNQSEYPVCDLGIIQAGAIKVPLNDMLGAAEIEFILEHSESELVIVGAGFIDMARHLKARTSKGENMGRID